MRFRISKNERKRIESFVKDYLIIWDKDRHEALRATSTNVEGRKQLSMEKFGLRMGFSNQAFSYWVNGGNPLPGAVNLFAEHYAIFASEYQEVYTNFLRLEFLSVNYC